MADEVRARAKPACMDAGRRDLSHGGRMSRVAWRKTATESLPLTSEVAPQDGKGLRLGSYKISRKE